MPTVARDVIFSHLRDLGVEYMFGVPGTNEIPIIDGTNVAENRIKYIPCLHENIAAGAASGYARMTGKPGVVVLHVTPGIAHAIGNLFNAAKSHIPLLVLCCQQASRLNLFEPLLYSNLVELARQYTRWAYEVQSADEFAPALQRALKVALGPPSGPTFLSIPWDFTMEKVEYAGKGKVTHIAPHFCGDVAALQAAADRLAEAKNPVIVVGDGVGYANAWPEIRALAEAIGAPVWSETFSSLMNYPNDLPHWCGELLGTQQDVQQAFKGHDVAFLCGFNAQAQVVVFDWKLGPLIPPDVRQIYLHNDAWQIGKNDYGEVAILGDIKTSLPVLLERIRTHPKYSADAVQTRNAAIIHKGEQRQQALTTFAATLRDRAASPANANGSTKITAEFVAMTLGRITLEGTEKPLTYVHEAVSAARAFQKYLHFDSPTAYYCVEGGSLGWSMPASLGIKLAVKDTRTVVNAVGDGSTLFYPQVWWTAAQHTLGVLYIIMNNRRYQTLISGLDAIEDTFNWKPSGDPWYLRLPDPNHDFITMAASFGVAGERVDVPWELEAAIRRGLEQTREGKPYVLDVMVAPLERAGLSANDLDPVRDILSSSQEFLP